ncbi:MAG: tripeptide aminopeptidase [Solirubrobacteraceae bacterium]|jgi:tripeptide aminopeptidase|nr:tripeptide aminopeptidase [Solirubrobacteraceae bacterium]
MRPASEVERRRLNDTFAELCAIRSPFGQERAVADRVAEELRSLGLEVEEDDAGAEIGGDAGNLFARLPGRSERSVLLCAHLDTVPDGGPVEPVLVDGAWESAGDTILGADNKATVAVLLGLAHRAAVEGTPIGVELVFTVGEENGLQGAKAFDASKLRSELGFVYDHASPIGEIVVASPTFYRLQATFRGQAAHAGVRPEDGRSAIVAAARAIAAMRLGRLDAETTANVGNIHGGADGTNIVPERCTLLAEARSLTETTADEVISEMVDRCYDAANDPECECDVDIAVERLFRGYRHKPSAASVVAAEAALRACGFTPKRITTGGASDANAFAATGLLCTNLANGTERNHESTERVSQASLQGMLDVTFALLDELSG